MAPTLSEDEIDDLLYFARVGEKGEFDALKEELCKREKVDVVELVRSARDSESGNGILHMAAANGHHTILLDLCKALSGSSPQNPTMLSILNAQNAAGNTALHWAALNGHLEAVKVLLDEGSDPTITNQKGHDAVYEAELNDKREVVEWVLKEGGEGLEEGLGGGAGEGSADADEDMGEGDGEAVDDLVDAKALAEGLKDLVVKDGEEKK
ncbi:ankyrin repeat-containing domain protein [Leptodontidium sp. MPI-SDFR-AT-0119]|nr:ankyrin repeat-containing domain protein [Leptodontidium sp. MPI-SDFR-AT-0119]